MNASRLFSQQMEKIIMYVTMILQETRFFRLLFFIMRMAKL